MSSSVAGAPQASSVTSASRASRRRQRSTRLTVATALLVLSALLVLGAVASGSALLVTVAALAAVVLGAAATRITHAELLASRRDANRDRAEQAQAYRRLAEARADEHAARVAELTGRLGEREVALGDLQTELVKTQRTAAESARQVEVAHRRNVDLEKEGRLVSSQPRVRRGARRRRHRPGRRARGRDRRPARRARDRHRRLALRRGRRPPPRLSLDRRSGFGPRPDGRSDVRHHVRVIPEENLPDENRFESDPGEIFDDLAPA